MRLVGMLLALAGVFALIYFLAGDIESMMGGRGDESTLAPAKITSEATDKANEVFERQRKQLEGLDK